MNVQPGNRPILDDDIVKAGKLIIEGLSFLEGRCSRKSDVCVFHSHQTHVPLSTGCTVVDLIPPCIHVFVHYPKSAKLFGVLLWYMMMAFERYNKLIKSLVGNATHPIASLKNALLRDAG